MFGVIPTTKNLQKVGSAVVSVGVGFCLFWILLVYLVTHPEEYDL